MGLTRQSLESREISVCPCGPPARTDWGIKRVSLGLGRVSVSAIGTGEQRLKHRKPLIFHTVLLHPARRASWNHTQPHSRSWWPAKADSFASNREQETGPQFNRTPSNKFSTLISPTYHNLSKMLRNKKQNLIAVSWRGPYLWVRTRLFPDQAIRLWDLVQQIYSKSTWRTIPILSFGPHSHFETISNEKKKKKTKI